MGLSRADRIPLGEIDLSKLYIRPHLIYLQKAALFQLPKVLGSYIPCPRSQFPLLGNWQRLRQGSLFLLHYTYNAPNLPLNPLRPQDQKLQNPQSPNLFLIYRLIAVSYTHLTLPTIYSV